MQIGGLEPVQVSTLSIWITTSPGVYNEPDRSQST